LSQFGLMHSLMN